MPHVIVKMYAGRTDIQKFQFAEAITRAAMAGTECTRNAASVSVEDVPQGEWVAAVYNPDIAGKADTLYKKPGHSPGWCIAISGRLYTPGSTRVSGGRASASDLLEFQASIHSGNPRQKLGSMKQSLKHALHRRDAQRLV